MKHFKYSYWLFHLMYKSNSRIQCKRRVPLYKTHLHHHMHSGNRHPNLRHRRPPTHRPLTTTTAIRTITITITITKIIPPKGLFYTFWLSFSLSLFLFLCFPPFCLYLAALHSFCLSFALYCFVCHFIHFSLEEFSENLCIVA